MEPRGGSGESMEYRVWSIGAAELRGDRLAGCEAEAFCVRVGRLSSAVR